jgi:hypothetical protein
MIWLFPLALLSGILGRLGGAGKAGNWYDKILDTKWRDIGCSLVFCGACWLFLGWHPVVYAVVFALHWAAFSTYWDRLFKGTDNLWFSGFVVGAASLPLLFINVDLWPILALRMGILTVVWGCLNRYLPLKGIWIWRRDIVEEFSRYFVSL